MNGVPLNIDFQQILLHLFNVVILFAILYFLIYKPVKGFMDKRKKEYEDMEAEAVGKVKDADELKASYEEKLKQAEAEIKTMKMEASKEAADHAFQTEEEARAKAKQILETARNHADMEMEKILSGAGEQVAQLARDAASKAIFENPSDAYDSFLNAAENK